MRKLVILFALAFLPFLYSCISSDASQQELDLLKRENELLKREANLNSSENEEKKKQVNEKLYLIKSNIRNNWNNYIRTDYKARIDKALGGVYDLELSVSNDTDYLIDEVDIIVSYIKDNGHIWKTENMTLYNIAAKSLETSYAPNSNRGTSVEVNISRIKSKKLNFCYSNGFIASGEDPYFCK